MQFQKQKAAELLSGIIGKNYESADLSPEALSAMLEYPPDTALGDLALPCFKLAKATHRPPAAIAETLAAELPADFASATAVNGYLNIKINPSALVADTLREIAEAGADYGSPKCGNGQTVVLDYSSPNTSKPFHIGHLGTTVIGHSLKLLHQFAGYECVGVNHLGDWGTQNGKQIVAYRRWGSREAVEAGGVDELVRLYVKFHEEAEKDPSLNDEARAEFTKLEHGDKENLELWRWFIELSMREYEKTYKQLGITFESYKGESFYSDKMQPQIDIMREKGLLKIDDGASVVDLEEYKMPPCLILKRDGSSLYPARDVAAAVYRMNTYHFAKAIYVTSSGQSLHFAQWFKVVELMGYDWYDRLVHVPYGTVSINGGKLATRTGNVVLLRDLFSAAIDKVKTIIAEKNPDLENADAVAEAVGVGAVIFHYLSNSRIKDINFKLDDALEFDGNTGPYAQYTYARTCSIIEKAGGAKISADIPLGEITGEETELAKVLSRFPENVKDALDSYEPSVITRYIFDLCSTFNRFYHNCQILNAEGDREKRLSLTAATKQVLGRALSLICIKTPEKI